MSKLAALVPLRDLLVELYPTRDGSYRVVDEAGLRRAHIAFDNAAIDNWQNILVEAYRRAKVAALVEVVKGEYAEQAEALDAALGTYEEAEERAEDLEPGAGRWRLWAALGVLIPSLLFLAYRFQARGNRETPNPPRAICLVPDSTLINFFQELDRFSLKVSGEPGQPSVFSQAPPLGVLCLTTLDFGTEPRSAWSPEIARACLLDHDILEKDFAHWEAPEFQAVPGVFELEDIYLVLEDTKGNKGRKGFVEPRPTQMEGFRWVCLRKDLAKDS